VKEVPDEEEETEDRKLKRLLSRQGPSRGFEGASRIEKESRSNPVQFEKK
jgi:hypothetical protein